jgi:HK97 family phage major capsid protein
MTPTTASTAVRDRLKEVQDRLREKRSERAEAKRERDAARDAFADVKQDGAQKITEMPEFQAAEEAVRKLGTIDDEIADLTVAERGILEMLGEADDPVGMAQQMVSDLPVANGWDARRILDPQDSGYREAVGKGLFSSSAQFGTVVLGEIATREQAAQFLADLPAAPAAPIDSPGTAGLIQPDTRGLVAPLLRPLRLLDLIPTGTTDSNSIEYVQIQSIPASAANVAEGAVKPQSGLVLADATAPVRTIAGWVKVNRQAMDDAAGLATIINSLLPYDVRRRIEAQILSGDGTGQNIKGILNQTGLGAPAFVSGDNTADAILRAMTVVILSEAEPNFAALNPLSWQDLLLLREVGGSSGANRSGQYLYGGPGTMAAATIWGLAITPTTMVAQAAPLVGDSRGATLLVREGVNVKTSDSDQDDFVRNRVTVLAEARVAFPVWRPASFAVADTTP